MVEVARAVRAALPTAMPPLLRLSATDWLGGGPAWPQPHLSAQRR
jgi:2,4-dienoyl-CoA reductase-like NADH-dependent reductase (Old Yellow Enzyme family)